MSDIGSIQDGSFHIAQRDITQYIRNISYQQTLLNDIFVDISFIVVICKTMHIVVKIGNYIRVQHNISKLFEFLVIKELIHKCAPDYSSNCQLFH